jgi:hypothetical protein
MQCACTQRIQAKHVLLVFLHYTKPKLEFFTVGIQDRTFCFWCEILHCCEYLEIFCCKIQVLFKKPKIRFFSPQKDA